MTHLEEWTLPKMDKSIILAELKNLRRYAFCLVGNSCLSDLTVEAVLGSLTTGAGETVTRQGLYRRVNEAARDSLRNGKVSAAVGSGLHARLLKLTEEERQITVLHSVIGFTLPDVASIMGLSEDRVSHIYAASLLSLRAKPMSVLIIEDEALIAHELQSIVRNLGLSVAGMARNRAEALRIADASRPQLIFADYKLRGDTGVDIVNAIREHLNASVIYVTAHPEAVAAAGANSDIVIPKPFNVRTVERAVQTHLAA
jgi:CheY-like chemotaxis protein